MRQRNAAQLKAFLTWVRGDRTLDALDRAWPVGVEIPEEDTLQERLQWHETELELLARAVDLGAWIQREEDYLRSVGLPWPDWADDSQVAAYASLPEAAAAADLARAMSRPLVELSERVAAQEHWPNSGEIVARLLDAVRERNISGYTASYERLARLHQVRADVRQRNESARVLSTAAPQLASALQGEPAHTAWDDWLPVFTESWSWAAAGQWISEFAAVNVNALQAAVMQAEDRIRLNVQDLSAKRAWSHAVDPSRLSRGSRAHLEQYARLVRQFGKTGGQYREQRKADIRDAMDRCRPAVPVWIMPLYRIADQLRITPNMFDVVIVDEASQAGVEATFLQYLAPRIVVIGDDKQVSPSAVGVNRQQLRDLANQHLYDDKFRATWQEPQQSLFDEAKMRFTGMLTLVEHRRCVPEIIGFSNQIAYEPDNIRLIPVRQFGADRLEPIRTQVVKDGYELGGPSTRTNPPEAEAIVGQIEKCIQDPAYDGLTFGVISLLGSAQARLIERMLQERIPLQELLARDLRCGDAADFQGSERDVMFLSMVISHQIDRRVVALTKTEYVQRYNVAASRAKDQMWLYHSIDPASLGNAEDMRRQLLEYCYGVRNRRSAPDDRVVTTALLKDVPTAPFDSLFEQRVCNQLFERGFTVIPQFESLGYFLDLVVIGAKTRLAIECDGDTWSGPEAYQRDMGRQRELERCGWHFFRVLESDFNLDPAKALAPLWERLTELEINPGSSLDPVAEELDEPVISVEGAPSPEVDVSDGVDLDQLIDDGQAIDVVPGLEIARVEAPLLPPLNPAATSNLIPPVEDVVVVPTADPAPIIVTPSVKSAATYEPIFDREPEPIQSQRAEYPPIFAAQPAGSMRPQDRTLLLDAAGRSPLTPTWVAAALAIGAAEAREILHGLVDEGALKTVGLQRRPQYVLATPDEPPAARVTEVIEQQPQRAVGAPRDECGSTVTASQREQLLQTAQHKPLTNEIVRSLLGVNALAALEILQSLVKAGKLERRGQSGGTQYRLIAQATTQQASSASSAPEDTGVRPPQQPPTDAPARQPLNPMALR